MTTTFIAIDIPMGALTSIADVALMAYLLHSSPVKPHRRLAKASRYVMVLAVIVYGLGSLGAKGSQIWGLTIQLDGGNLDNGSVLADGVDDEGDPSVHRALEALAVFQHLSAATSAIILLFSIGFAGLCVFFLRKMSERYALHKRMRWAVTILGASFLARSALCFVLWLIYSEFDNTTPIGVQVVYSVFYGPLSVTLYLGAILTAVAQAREDALTKEPVYGAVEQTMSTTAPEWQWQPQKPQYYVRVDDRN
jgi:hypothetical protein